MTIIEQIKSYIERQIKDPVGCCYGISSINKLRELLDFIGSLEPEKPEPFFYCKCAGIMPVCSDCKRNLLNSSFKTEDVQNWLDPANRGTKQCGAHIPMNESEKPMQEGLEEEYKDYVENDPVYSKLVNRIAGLSIANHFAQWGAEHSRDEMMQEAVEHYVVSEIAGRRVGPAIVHFDENFIIGDKVRVIIVKE